MLLLTKRRLSSAQSHALRYGTLKFMWFCKSILQAVVILLICSALCADVNVVIVIVMLLWKTKFKENKKTYKNVIKRIHIYQKELLTLSNRISSKAAPARKTNWSNWSNWKDVKIFEYIIFIYIVTIYSNRHIV